MGEEIERKFLVTGNAWRTGKSSDYRQGYLSIDKQRTVRIRIAGEAAFLTVKGITEGATRAEYEYPFPSPMRKPCSRSYACARSSKSAATASSTPG